MRTTSCVVAIAVVGAAVCGGKNQGLNLPGASQTPFGLTVCPSTDLLKIKGDDTFTAAATHSNGNSRTVDATWFSDNSGGRTAGLEWATATVLALARLAPGDSLAQTVELSRSRPSPAVRPTGPRAAYTLRRGLELCPTIRALAAELERSDVIVYVAIRPRETGPAATIAFLGASATARFVRVVLRNNLTTKQMIVLIGHELRHALEVARAPGVRDAASFDAHYRCRGLGTADPNRFDTRAAVLAGERVRQELALAGIKR